MIATTQKKLLDYSLMIHKKRGRVGLVLMAKLILLHRRPCPYRMAKLIRHRSLCRYL